MFKLARQQIEKNGEEASGELWESGARNFGLKTGKELNQNRNLLRLLYTHLGDESESFDILNKLSKSAKNGEEVSFGLNDFSFFSCIYVDLNRHGAYVATHKYYADR